MVVLWNIIRDWFVTYIFGGVTSTLEFYSGFLGSIYNGSPDYYEDMTNINYYVNVGGLEDFGETTNVFLSLGDWLSSTATIITLVALCFALAFFIRWIFRVFSNAIILR